MHLNANVCVFVWEREGESQCCSIHLSLLHHFGIAKQLFNSLYCNKKMRPPHFQEWERVKLADFLFLTAHTHTHTHIKLFNRFYFHAIIISGSTYIWSIEIFNSIYLYGNNLRFDRSKYTKSTNGKSIHFIILSLWNTIWKWSTLNKPNSYTTKKKHILSHKIHSTNRIERHGTRSAFMYNVFYRPATFGTEFAMQRTDRARSKMKHCSCYGKIGQIHYMA